MATSRRVSRVAELIKREVSQMLLYGIKDDRVGTGMVSVTDVDVSGDLQHAKIFVSIYGTEEAKVETMAGLKSATATFVVNSAADSPAPYTRSVYRRSIYREGYKGFVAAQPVEPCSPDKDLAEKDEDSLDEYDSDRS